MWALHQSAQPRSQSGVYSRCFNIEHVACSNCTKFDAALPNDLGNKPAECEVDRVTGSRDMRTTNKQNLRFSASYMPVRSPHFNHRVVTIWNLSMETILRPFLLETPHLGPFRAPSLMLETACSVPAEFRSVFLLQLLHQACDHSSVCHVGTFDRAYVLTHFTLRQPELLRVFSSGPLWIRPRLWCTDTHWPSMLGYTPVSCFVIGSQHWSHVLVIRSVLMSRPC